MCILANKNSMQYALQLKFLRIRKAKSMKKIKFNFQRNFLVREENISCDFTINEKRKSNEPQNRLIHRVFLRTGKVSFHFIYTSTLCISMKHITSFCETLKHHKINDIWVLAQNLSRSFFHPRLPTIFFLSPSITMYISFHVEIR